MLPPPLLVIAGTVLIVVALAIRGVAVNRVVRSRLLFSVLLAAGALGLRAALAWSPDAALHTELLAIARLLVVLAAIQLVVVLLVNPLRVDRIADRFPTIVQDTIVVGLFMLVATFLLDERFLTTSAVGAAIVGFALQDTLGNMFAGLALQIEKPFHVGHWITVGDWEGSVVEVSWRATKLRTREGNLVILPNSKVAAEAITNYSEPIAPTRLAVTVGATYARRPNEVKRVILDALANEPVVRTAPPPLVLLDDFGASALQYEVNFWTDDYAQEDVVRDRVRCAIVYAFARAGVEIPYPMQVEMSREEFSEPEEDRVARLEAALGRASLLQSLTPDERRQLARESQERPYGAGEPIVRQGDPGTSAFVVDTGRVRVTIDPGAREVAQIGPGGFFGEMSLLTGDARSATVRAIVDCRVVEVTADSFRRIALQNPAVLESITATTIARRTEMTATVQGAAPAPDAGAAASTLLGRVRRFLLGSAKPA